MVFNESDRINSEEDLSKVESVIGESHIICLIKKKILIFNEEGRYIYYNPYQEDIHVDVPYYSLIYYKKDVSYVQFLVGFISDHKLNLTLYGYQQNYQLISVLGTFAKTNAIENQGLSCHNMNHSISTGSLWWSSTQYVNAILCIYTATGNKMIFDFFEINNKNEIITSTNRDFIEEYLGVGESVIYIKGDLFNGNTSILFGWLTEYGVPYYRLYDIEAKKFKTDSKKFVQSYCELKPYGFKIKYYPEKNEAMYTCLLQSNEWTVPKANILVETLGIYGRQTNYTYKFNDCQFDGYSIIYHENKTEYYIILNAFCQNETKSFCYL